MELLSIAIVELGKCILSPAVKCWRYYRDINANMIILKNDLQELNSKRSVIQKDLEDQHVPGETEVRDDVNLWLERVKSIEKEINITEEKMRDVKYFSRSYLGKVVVQKIQEVQKLQGCTFLGRLVRSSSKCGLKLTPSKAIESRSGTTFDRKVEEIWASLLDREVTKIGVYGMAGIGKTTALMCINDRILESRDMFDNVIWVTVSSDTSIASLQDKIAYQLHLTFSYDETTIAKASKLHTRLVAKKRFVLILDDLWEAYCLSEVGVPDPTPENGCKVVVTTRSTIVCNGIQVNKLIKMELRPEMEAIKLFEDTVGDQVRGKLLSDQKLVAIMKQIVQECAGLPLAIVIIAGRLIGTTDHDEWIFVLDELREPEQECEPSKKIIKILKSSYEHLNEELKQCVLYCALFPEDYEIQIEFLIEHLIVEKIIKNKETRQSQTRMGRVMLKKLQGVCLLSGTIDRNGAKCVKMHDLIRDMALQIASESYGYLVKPGPKWECMSEEDKWKQDVQKVSLANIRTTSLSSIPPNSPQVLTLFLYESYELNFISNEFFLHMKALSVLNLSFTSLVKLPESISDLENLTALFLRKCYNMRYVPSLAKLIKLKTLDFYHSGINLIPEGLEMLVNLRYLNFDGCPLFIMPSRVLQKLTNLQYLVLPHSHQEPKTETWRQGPKMMFYDGHSYSAHQGPKVKAEDLELLTKLETFEGVFYDVNSFNTYVGSLQQKRLTHYIHHLGFSNSYVYYASDQDHNKIVFLTGNLQGSSTSTTARECLLSLPKDVNILTIHHCHSASSLCDFVSVSDVSELWLCHVEDCGGIEHLFSYSSRYNFALFPNLETLNLDGVRDLRGFIKWERSFPLPHGSFSILKELSMCNCNNVKALFVFKVASLPNLEQLTLSRCEKLEAIVSTNEEEIIDQASIVITLPKVRRIILSKLPKLQNVPVITDSLQEIHIDECPMLKKIDPLLDREQCPALLMHVYIDRDTWERLEWGCDNAKYFVMSLMNLAHDSGNLTASTIHHAILKS